MATVVPATNECATFSDRPFVQVSVDGSYICVAPVVAGALKACVDFLEAVKEVQYGSYSSCVVGLGRAAGA